MEDNLPNDYIRCLTLEESANLKPGDKLVFIRNSGVSMGRIGEICTFAKHLIWEEAKAWDPRKPEHWAEDYEVGKLIQIQELLDQGNKEHNFDYRTLEKVRPIFIADHSEELKMLSGENNS